MAGLYVAIAREIGEIAQSPPIGRLGV